MTNQNNFFRSYPINSEYEVKDVIKLEKFLDKEIGTEYETSRYRPFKDGYIVVFDLIPSEHLKIKEFITNNNLWIEEE